MRSFFKRFCCLFVALPLCVACTQAQGRYDKTTPIVNKFASFAPTVLGLSESSPDAFDSGVTITSSTASYSRMVSLGWAVSRKREASISLEKMKVASFYYQLEGGQSEKPDWYFKSIPITFALNQNIGNPDWRITPILGVGASLYLSKTRTRITDSVNEFERHLGAGVGIQGTFGLKTRITSNTFVLSQARYRIIDGLAFSAHDPAYQFDMFDFAIGFGIDF